MRGSWLFDTWIVATLAFLALVPSLAQAEPLAAHPKRQLQRLPKLTTIGRLVNNPSLVSLAGKEFELYQFAPLSPRRSARAPIRFLIQGGLHGNEVQTSAFVTWLVHRYARGESPLNQLGDDVAIDFMPHANPDGAADKSRSNGRGVNLNRNFDVLWGKSRENPGARSFSEPETRAIRALFAQQRYLAAADVHGYINWVVMPTDPDDMRTQGFKPTARQTRSYHAWHKALVAKLPKMPGYEVKTAGKLGDGGAFEDWAFWSEDTLALCLEMETFQRFVKPWSSGRTQPGLVSPGQAVDLFERYELFLSDMFAEALTIHADERLASD